MISPASITRSPLRTNVLAGYLLQLAFYAIPLLTVPYLVLTLGTEAYGKLAFTQVVMMFGVLFLDAGIDTASSKELADKSSDDKQVALRLLAVSLLKTLIAVGILILLLVYHIAGGENAVLLLAHYLMLLGSLTFPAWFFQGMEVMKYTLVCGVAGRLVSAILLFSLVHSPTDLTLAAALQASGSLISGLLALYVLRRQFQIALALPFQKVRDEAVITFRQARSLFLAEFTDRACANSPVFVLGVFTSPAITGTFAAIEKFIRAAHGLVYPLQRAVFPIMCRKWQQNRASALADLAVKVRSIVILTSFAAGACFLAAGQILSLGYGDTWQNHDWILQTLTVWLIFAATNSYAGANGLVAAGRKEAFTQIALTSAVVQMALLVSGAFIAQTSGLLAGLLIGEVLRTLLIFNKLTKKS